MTCLVCQREGAEVVTAWTTRPVQVALCAVDQHRWQSVFGIEIRPDRPGASRPVPPLGSERSRTAAANAVRVSRAA